MAVIRRKKVHMFIYGPEPTRLINPEKPQKPTEREDWVKDAMKALNKKN